MIGVSSNSGIYAIYQNQVVNYVGQGLNLASRLKDHLKEAYNCFDNGTLAQLKYYWAPYTEFWIDEVEAIVIRTASVTNLAVRNLQNAADVQIEHGVVARVYNLGKVPNFIKTPGFGNLAAGHNQPQVFDGANQVK